jgi:hypothetical protein
VASDEERLAEQLAEELKRLRVEDVVVQAVVTVSSIGYRSLGLTEETRAARDLDQARLAIEAMQALVPVLEQVLPPEATRDLQASVANLQLAFAKAAQEPGAPRGERAEPREEPAEPREEAGAEEGEPAG